MPEKQLRINGPIAVVIVVILLGWRFLTIGESNDQALQEAISAELMNRLGSSISRVTDETDVGNAEDVDALLNTSNADNITIHSMRVSKPLLSFGSSIDAVVRVDYTLPGRERRTEFFRFTHSTIAGWRYRRPVSIASFYLNFI